MIYPFLIPIALVDILCAMSVMFTSGSKALLTLLRSYCYHKYTASKTCLDHDCNHYELQ